MNFENTLDNNLSFESTSSIEEASKDIPSGVSMDNAAYMENNINNTQENIENNSISSEDIIEEYTPKLFSEENSFQEDSLQEDVREVENNDLSENESEQLFDQDMNEEEDFEIPAFLRKQKF